MNNRFTPLAASLAIATASTALAADWPHYNGINSDRATAEELPSTKLPGKPAWKVDTNTGFSSFITTIIGGCSTGNGGVFLSLCNIKSNARATFLPSTFTSIE